MKRGLLAVSVALALLAPTQASGVPLPAGEGEWHSRSLGNAQVVDVRIISRAATTTTLRRDPNACSATHEDRRVTLTVSFCSDRLHVTYVARGRFVIRWDVLKPRRLSRG